MRSDDEQPEDGPDEAPGYNSQVSHQGRLYHVQTEALDFEGRQHINSIVFLNGALVHKQSTSYAELTQSAHQGGALATRVRKQHQETLARLCRGEFDRA